VKELAMQTARVTVLMTPDRKAELESRAADMGVSSGEFIRLAVDNFNPSDTESAELAALIDELSEAVPRMRAALDRSVERLDSTHAKVDRLLRDMGVRA
jgi:hypothetical protein